MKRILLVAGPLLAASAALAQQPVNVVNQNLSATNPMPARLSDGAAFVVPALDTTVTGRFPLGSTPADNESNAATITRSGAFLFVFDGTAWDRWTGLISAAQSGTWTVQPGNTANTTPWLFRPHDGTLGATVRDTGTADSLNVAVVDAAGNQVTSFSGGTQYLEDDPAAANPTGTAPILVRQDTPAGLTSANGDNLAQRGTNFGAGYVQVVTSAGTFVDSFGGSGGTAQADRSAFTDGTTNFTPIGGTFNETNTNPTEDQGAAVRITDKRGFHVNLRTNAGTEVGTSGAPIRVDPTGSTTQPISGTVTANAGTNLNTSALALETTLGRAQGSTTSGQTGPLIQGAVTTAAPTYTTAQTNPLSLTAMGGLRVETTATVATASGSITAAGQTVAITVGSYGGLSYQTTGTWSGTLNPETTIDGTNWGPVEAVDVADGAGGGQIAFTTNVIAALNVSGYQQFRVRASAFTSGTATVSIRVHSGGVMYSPPSIVIGGFPNNEPFNVAQWGGLATSLGQKTMGSSVPVVIASDQSGVAIVSTSADQVTALLSQTGTDNDVDVVGTVTANAGTGNFNVVGTKSSDAGAPGATNLGVLAAVANAAAPTFTEGNQTALSVNTAGALRVIGGGGGTEYVVNAVTPADPTGTTLVSERDDQLAALTEIEGDWTNTRATSKGALWVAIPDVNGDPITSFGGGTQYSEDTVAAAAEQVTMAGVVRDDTPASLVDLDGDRTELQVDGTGRLWVNGSGVTQPISGTVTANAGTGTFVVGDGAGALNVIVDSGVLATVTTVTNLTNLPNEGQQTAANSISVTPDTDNDSVGATAAAPPGEATFVGGLTSGATGGFLAGVTVCDTTAAVSISTITTTLAITGVAGRHVYICAINLVTALANNVAVIAGTTTTTPCDTSAAGLAGGSTAATGWNLAANGGLAQGSGFGVVISTNGPTGAATGDNVCIATSAATQLSGSISYAIY